MNYYIDTEFIEDFTNGIQLPSFRRHKVHYIDLISIGIVAEDGREYYAVSKEFDLKHVWNKYDLQLQGIGDEPKKIYWLRENVLRPIWEDLRKNVSGFAKDHTSAHETFTYNHLKTLIQWYGKPKAQIAQEIQLFTANMIPEGLNKNSLWEAQGRNKHYPPTFYGYYCDYDWVVFCSLFGRMLDLPKGYPMYMRDLKQVMDNLELGSAWKEGAVPGDNEHHALADARWNRKLHKALQEFPAFLPNQ